MFNDLSIFNDASALARHAAQRLAVLSENIANADTPKYRARDLEPFSDFLSRLDAAPQNSSAPKIVTLEGISTDANGNSVSIEDQMARGAEAMRRHETAMTIYAKALGLLRAGLGAR